MRPQDVSNGNDFVHPYKWNRNRLPQMSAPPPPLRCIWERKHYASTASGAFVLDEIEQCPQKEVRRIPVAPILRTHAETKPALCEGRRLYMR